MGAARERPEPDGYVDLYDTPGDPETALYACVLNIWCVYKRQTMKTCSRE